MHSSKRPYLINLKNNIIAAAEQACLLLTWSMECGSTDDMRRLAAHWPDLRHRRPPARSLAPSSNPLAHGAALRQAHQGGAKQRHGGASGRRAA